MKKLLLLLLFIPLVFFGQDCPPCNVLANPEMEITKVKSSWPKLKNQKLVKINSLTSILYENEDKYWTEWKRKSWWMKEGSDPWTEDPIWGDKYVKPNLNFSSCVNDNLRWKCGYSYVLKIPDNFKKNKKYPLVIFLHGGINSTPNSLNRRIKSLNNFHVSKDDQYILAAPLKLGIDWSAKKIQDLIEDVKSNLKIDNKRIYLTGLSMGGRGTFIVASKLPEIFAAIMPLSPHHQPYSYLSLSEKISHLPTFLHHSRNDKTSKFSMAESMFNKLLESNDNLKFDIGSSGHSGWNNIYSNEKIMNWFLSWEK
ncbi:MAG: hypothetical protein CMC38_06955 [Flavobacteriaceae bacterium]|nr:hypothetical protein [Flavobacteriaceae bacterium]|tara:strand:- start:84 stop:1016 length:933 start_codon:yes stop_codon:yes gene_type:complete